MKNNFIGAVLVLLAIIASHSVHPHANSPLSKVMLMSVSTIGFLWPITIYVTGRNLLHALRSRTAVFRPIAFFLLAVLLAPLALFAYAPPEGIFLFNPGIDTRYAPGFSEQAFAQVRVGMPEIEVRQLLGEPLSAFPGHDREYDYILSYTGDGACSWGDFAWKHRWVKIREGRVQGVDRGWSYDCERSGT